MLILCNKIPGFVFHKRLASFDRMICIRFILFNVHRCSYRRVKRRFGPVPLKGICHAPVLNQDDSAWKFQQKPFAD